MHHRLKGEVVQRQANINVRRLSIRGTCDPGVIDHYKGSGDPKGRTTEGSAVNIPDSGEAYRRCARVLSNARIRALALQYLQNVSIDMPACISAAQEGRCYRGQVVAGITEDALCDGHVHF